MVCDSLAKWDELSDFVILVDEQARAMLHGWAMDLFSVLEFVQQVNAFSVARRKHPPL